MTLEIRPTDDPKHFDLYDDIVSEKFGEIYEVPLDEEGVALGESPDWHVLLWSVMGTGKEWIADAESVDQAKEYAHEMYEEFAAERRELSKGSQMWTTGSVPLGGKPGWRRR